jgi:hypothetical protein
MFNSKNNLALNYTMASLKWIQIPFSTHSRPVHIFVFVASRSSKTMTLTMLMCKLEINL